MINIRIIFYILVCVVFRNQIFLLFGNSPTNTFNEVYFFPFSQATASSLIIRKFLALSFIASLFFSFIKDNVISRLFLALTLYFVASIGMMISPDGIFHSHWDYCLIAFMGLILKETEDWLYYSRIIIALKYFLAGLNKILFMITMPDHGTIKTISFVTMLFENKKSILFDFIIENSSIGYAIFIAVALIQIGILIPVVHNKYTLGIGCLALLFHITNHILFGILFFPVVLLIILFFIVSAHLTVDKKANLIRDLFANRLGNL